ncbi:hypothetical protein ACFWMS_22265 [Peribacillus butanolivorans]|uniref:hypothetical protein n=1 Tax=Peribacillus butanolivorans TaxID=421767 RepID=UPI00365222F4
MTSNNIENYKDTEKRLTLLHDKEWVATINLLKNFHYDDKFDYSVSYREGKQRKDRTFTFHSVLHVEETNSFIFTSYESDWESGELTKDVKNKLTLKDIEIINFNQREKPNFDYFFI